MKRFKLLLALSTAPLWGINMEFSGVKTTYLTSGKADYDITSKQLVKKFDSQKTLGFFLNAKGFMLQNNYYKEGNFKYKELQLKFKKAFKYSGKFFMYGVSGNFKDAKIKANEAYFYKNRLYLRDCEVITAKRIIRRKKYIFNISE